MSRLRAAWVALLLSVAAPVAAQPSEPDEATRAEARRLGYDGLSAFEAKRWAVAYERFRAAEELVHSPVFVLYMARAKLKLGDLLEASRLLASVERSGRPGEDAAWQRARDDAAHELVELERRIPKLVVQAEPAPANYGLQVDGEAAKLGEPLRLNPGKHTVTLLVGQQRRVETLELAPAEGTRKLVLKLEEGSSPPRKATAKATETPPQGDVGQDTQGDEATGVPAWLSFGMMGLGAVSLGVSGFAWLKANDQADAAKENCQGNVCPEENQGAKDDALLYANVSTWTLIGGAALVVGGGVLWLTSSDSKTQVGVGPRFVTVQSSF
ncbi:MAG: hypothetical protein H6718_32480 [Polyangiaceae bacterium]|nr:hypothetical protein [Polyangiaceae bacterium]MCB9608055.1 hypothetical protein [Polyangiaceae bacterium]